MLTGSDEIDKIQVMNMQPNSVSPTIAELQKILIEQQHIIERHEKTIASSASLINVLEEKLRLLNQKQFAKRGFV